MVNGQRLIVSGELVAAGFVDGDDAQGFGVGEDVEISDVVRQEERPFTYTSCSGKISILFRCPPSDRCKDEPGAAVPQPAERLT